MMTGKFDIDSKEETNIAGHATIFKNAQETQKSAEVIQESQESQKTEEVIQEPQKTKKPEIKEKLMASENIILDKARKLLYHLDRPYPALCLVEPLYQKYGETETVLEVYLSALAWCNPKKAMELAESLCSVEGYRVQIEDAIRRKDSLQADQKLQEAKERWPEHIGLQLLEVVVKIALYRDYKEEAFLEEGRKILSAMSNPENSVERSWQYLLKAFLNNENETINVTSGAFVQNGLYWHVVSRFFFLLHGLKKMEKECEIACGVNSSTGMLYWGDKERFFTANSHGNEVEWKDYDSAGRLERRWEFSYDNQGNQVERKEYDSAGCLEWRWESSYDNQGNEVERKEYDSAGCLEWRWEYSYDNQGNEVEEKLYDSAGRLERRWEFSYDNQGNEVERKEYVFDGRLERRWEFSYDNQGNEVGWKEYDFAGRLRWEYSYDNQGNDVERKKYDSAGRLERRWEFSYDNQGNQVEEKEYDSAGRLWQRWESSYDNQGNQVEKKEYDSAGRLEKRWTYSYDNHGNEVGWKEYDSAGHLVAFKNQ